MKVALIRLRITVMIMCRTIGINAVQVATVFTVVIMCRAIVINAVQEAAVFTAHITSSCVQCTAQVLDRRQSEMGHLHYR